MPRYNGKETDKELINRLTTDFKKAKELIHELITHCDRSNAEIDRLTTELNSFKTFAITDNDNDSTTRLP